MKVPLRPLALFAVLCAAALVSCAREAQEPQVPLAAPPPPAPAGEKRQAAPTDIDALERDLLHSETQMDRQLAFRLARLEELDAARKEDIRPASPSVTTAGPAPTTSPQPAAARPPAREAPAKDLSSDGSPCEVACKALASMQRSVEGICRLAGEEHERCRTARDRVQRAAGRIAAAGCPCADTSD